MTSYSDFVKPTPGQRIKDDSFIRSVRNDLRPGLLEELESLHEGFSSMNTGARIHHLVHDNIPFHGKGDCLPVEYGNMLFYAFAGCELRDYAVSHMSEGVQTYCRFPFISEREANETFGENVTSFFNSVRDSDLKLYLYNENPYNRLDLADMPKYESLPIAYRVALVCLYVSSHVVALPSDITAFVLGATDELETHRYIIKPTKDADGLNNGWVIRIRDLRPSQDFGKHLADHLKSIVTQSEAEELEHRKWMEAKHTEEQLKDYRLDSQFEPKPKVRKRAPNEETQTLVAFIDDLAARGKSIGRSGDMSWEDAAGMLARDYGIVRTGRNLRDSYNSYKKRHGSNREGR